jgi:ureidoglycolate dehydrogenase (NAD+)
MDKEIIVSSIELIELCIKKLMSHGLSQKHAGIVADVLVHANLRGVDSHGINRMGHYIQRLKAGGLNPNPNIQMKSTGPCSAIVDGDDGFGHIIAKEAMDHAIAIAEQNGVGMISIINSSHCGALSYFVNQAVEHNMIGIMMVNTDKFVVPFGAAEPYFGTNPIAFGFPTNQQKPIILDMATSQVAVGKILYAKQVGKSIPADWAVDAEGNPTEDPNQVVALNPMGGPKGTGLALVIDIFSGILTGSGFGPHVSQMYGNYNKARKLGHFLMAINISCLTDSTIFKYKIDQLIDELHQLQPAPGHQSVYIPGEPEQMKVIERMKYGIPVPESTYTFLQE